MNDDRTPGPEEQAQASELARTLAGEGEMEMGRDRAQAVLRRVMAEAGPALDRRARAPAWRRWLMPVGGLSLASATAAALLLLWPTAPALLPGPDPALLQAQARAAGAEGDAVALRKGMRAYRGRMLAALDERYGGGS